MHGSRQKTKKPLAPPPPSTVAAAPTPVVPYWKRPVIAIPAAILLFCFPLFFGFTFVPLHTGDVVAGTTTEHLDNYHSIDPTGTLGELSYSEFTKNTFKLGQFPFWSPYQSLGHPFLGNGLLSAIFPPVMALRFILPSSQWWLLYVLNLLVAAYAIYGLCRAYDCSTRAAIVGGLSYLAVGSTLLYLTVPSVMSVAIWAPCLFLGIERLIAKPAAHLKTGGLLLILGAFGVITGGQITVSLLVFTAAAIYVCARLVQTRPSLLSIRTAAIAGAIALLLPAIQWIPYFGYASYRGNTYEDYSKAGAFTISDLPAFFFPYLYGRLHDPYTATNPPFAVGNGAWSIGWLPPGLLVLAVAGVAALVQRRLLRSGQFALVLASAPLWLWAFQVPPFALASSLPFMNRARGQYTAVALGFAVCILVALGFQHLEDRGINLKTLAAFTIGVLAAVTVWGGLIFLNHDVTSAQTFRYLFDHLGYSFLWAVLAIGALALATFRPRTPDSLFFIAIGLSLFSAIAFFPWASGAAMDHAHQSALICFAIAVLALYFLPTRTAALSVALLAAVGSRAWVMMAPGHLPHQHDLFEPRPYTTVLQKNMEPGYRAYGLDGYLFPNWSSAYAISSTDILTPMVMQQVERFYQRYLDAYQAPEQFGGLDRAGPGRSPVSELVRNQRFWDYLGVRYIVAKDSQALAGSAAEQVFRNGLWFSIAGSSPFATFGTSGDLPVLGDWNGDGRLKIGVFRKGSWIVDWNGNNHWDAEDEAHAFSFGAAGDIPVMGDWNGNRRLKIGVFRKGSWIVDWNGNHRWDAEDAAHTFSFGAAGDVPVMGDWNGDGRLKVGVFRQGGWIVDWNGNYQWDNTDATHAFTFGVPGDVPVMGDWNGDGRLKVGVFRKDQWFIDWNGNNKWDAADGEHVFSFGAPGDTPLMTSPNKGSFTSFFKDYLTHAAVWENPGARLRAYVAPHTRQAGTWEQAQDQFAGQSDLRDTAFVEEPTSCAASNGSPGAIANISGLTISANSVEMDVDAQTPGMLVVTDAYMPGWDATVDGRPQRVVRVNGTFRGTCLQQPGKHRVAMNYRPPNWALAVLLSSLGLAGLIAFAYVPKIRGG